MKICCIGSHTIVNRPIRLVALVGRMYFYYDLTVGLSFDPTLSFNLKF